MIIHNFIDKLREKEEHHSVVMYGNFASLILRFLAN